MVTSFVTRIHQVKRATSIVVSHVRTLKCGGSLKHMLCSRQTPVPKVSLEERLYLEVLNKRCRLQSTCTERFVGLNPTIMAPRRYCSHDPESASIEKGAQVGSFHLQALYIAPANLLNILPACGDHLHASATCQRTVTLAGECKMQIGVFGSLSRRWRPEPKIASKRRRDKVGREDETETTRRSGCGATNGW
jgi:hypothetical protein